MNYLNPSAYAHLPPRARCSMAAVYSLIIASAKDRARAECDRSQGAFAAWLECSERTIRRHERQLVALGLLEVVHHRRGNRRVLRIVDVKTKPKPARECGQFCPDSADRSVRTLRPAALITRARTHARVSDLKNPAQEESARARTDAPGGHERRSSTSGAVLRGTSPADQKRIQSAVNELYTRCNVFRSRLPEVVELVAQWVALKGVSRTCEDLAWVVKQNEHRPLERRGKMTMGLLRSMLAKIEEKGGARTHKVHRGAS